MRQWIKVGGDYSSLRKGDNIRFPIDGNKYANGTIKRRPKYESSISQGGYLVDIYFDNYENCGLVKNFMINRKGLEKEGLK